MKKVPACSSFDKTNISIISIKFLNQLDIFYGLYDRYDALVGAFYREGKKEIDTDFKAENLNDIEVILKGMQQSAVDEKLKTIGRD